MKTYLFNLTYTVNSCLVEVDSSEVLQQSKGGRNLTSNLMVDWHILSYPLLETPQNKPLSKVTGYAGAYRRIYRAPLKGGP